MRFLDKRNQLIADEVRQTGAVDHTPVFPREVVKRALKLGIKGVVILDGKVPHAVLLKLLADHGTGALIRR